MDKQYVEIVGVVDSVTFTNGDSGFTVLNLEYGDDLLTVVGVMPNVSTGEELKLTGFFGTHPTFGEQFKVVMYEQMLPSTSVAIQRYLASGVIKGIGDKLAGRIVDLFGDETLHILENTPNRLAEVKGISKSKLEQYTKDIQEIFGVKTLMMFLSKHGITPIQSIMIWKKWGKIAKELIISNPYLLCNLDFNIAFSVADQIAREYSIKEDNPARVVAGVTYVLLYNTRNGHTCLPCEKLVTAAEQLLGVGSSIIYDCIDEAVQNQQIYRLESGNDYLFTPEYFIAEEYIAERLKSMINKPSKDDEDIDSIITQCEQERGITYATLQKKAMVEAFRNNVFILTGGPGTGKTTTLNTIIELFEKSGKKVSVAAPTGRAAKRLTELTGKEARTIHRLLEVEFTTDNSLVFARHEGNPLESDVVIIDEMSMVDSLLFSSLLKGMKQSCKLIMVGDFNQLPSVGAGNVLQDLRYSDVIPTVELTQIFRQAATSLIVTNAHLIIKGEMPDISRKDNDFFFMSSNNGSQISQTIVELCSKRLPNTYGFSPTEHIQVLSPTRKGEIGTIEINKNLQRAINPPSPEKAEFNQVTYTFREGDKVMQIKNNYDIPWKRDGENGAGIFNGDIGIIKMIDKGSKTVAIDFEGRVSYYSFDMANELELAYAVTVHKSQGSEFDAIILPIYGGFDKLYFRNLLYTAVTRAKKLLIIIGSKQRLNFMVSNNKKMLRYTGLRHMLKDDGHKG